MSLKKTDAEDCLFLFDQFILVEKESTSLFYKKNGWPYKTDYHVDYSDILGSILKLANFEPNYAKKFMIGYLLNTMNHGESIEGTSGTIATCAMMLPDEQYNMIMLAYSEAFDELFLDSDYQTSWELD